MWDGLGRLTRAWQGRSLHIDVQWTSTARLDQ
ncbi:MAG: hypothetical protein JWO12_613, partial [Frankiales bacterium]|nr:hypothetical protein [Frankiales bacterium]